MFSWWSSSPGVEEGRCAPRRTVRTKQVHVEVIGGGGPSSAAARDRQSVLTARRTVGPPRLPSELITHILLLAAELLVESGADNTELLQLGLVDRSAHHAILSAYILADLRLHGARQVRAFARDIQRNVLGLQYQVKGVKRLSVRRGGDRTPSEHASPSSLFSDAEDLAGFEKATLEPLQRILSWCTNIEHLSLDMPARVLDERQGKSKGSLCRSLKELITLLSVYGGDLNEALWYPGSLSLPRWSHLTHLQLHGPRFRMTAMTAMAISQLPSLTHLALIMPLVIQPRTTPSPSEYGAMDRTVDRARDALGRCNVFQILIDSIGHRLQTLLLVCHEVESYVGSVQRLGSWLQTLHWKCNMTVDEKGGGEATSLVLVTAKPVSLLQTPPHPSLFSKWMLQRADRGAHWDWGEGEKGGGCDRCQGMDLAYRVEKWTIPIVYERSSEAAAEMAVETQGRQELRPDDDTARRWLGIATANQGEQDASSDSVSSSDEPSGIDNLD